MKKIITIALLSMTSILVKTMQPPQDPRSRWEQHLEKLRLGQTHPIPASHLVKEESLEDLLREGQLRELRERQRHSRASTPPTPQTPDLSALPIAQTDKQNVKKKTE